MIENLINVKCINGTTKLTVLRGLYCKHYKFEKLNMNGSNYYVNSGCCYGKKHYDDCKYYNNPKHCNNFIPNANVKGA